MDFIAENICLRVDDETYLDDVNFHLAPGSVNIFLGHTLAGKTSLLRIIAGLDRPTSGRILTRGKDVTGVSVQKRNISMVYQQFINYPSFTVFDNIASPLKVAGMDKKTIEERVEETAALLHLEDYLDRLPEELSGGQQQRCAIARALVKDADLLLLDEPLVNLDYKLREELQSELSAIFARKKAIVIYTTTEPAEALKLGGNIMVLDQGRILQSGPTSQVFHSPAHVRCAQVFSDPPINLIPCQSRNGEFILGEENPIPLPPALEGLDQGEYQAGLRAHHLSIQPRGQNDMALETRIELTEINGSETFFHVRYQAHRLVVQETGIHAMKIGSPLKVYLDPTRLFIFSPRGSLVTAPAIAHQEVRCG
ncbi:MAG: ABC transporter ATP-binding protein [Desulfobacterales bacterium]|nr:ABC transporter ATP-binding protein [Desulfobacterales bacterium]